MVPCFVRLSICALLNVSGFFLAFLVVDVLLCADLGTKQDAICDRFVFFIISKFVFRMNMTERLVILWGKIIQLDVENDQAIKEKPSTSGNRGGNTQLSPFCDGFSCADGRTIRNCLFRKYSGYVHQFVSFLRCMWKSPLRRRHGSWVSKEFSFDLTGCIRAHRRASMGYHKLKFHMLQ